MRMPEFPRDCRHICVLAYATGKYVLPAPSADLAGQVFKVMRSITHLEEKKGKELFSLGIKNDRIELGVEFDDTKDKELLTIVFPSA